MRNRLGRMEAFDALLEELADAALESRAASPPASDDRPEARYAGARMKRDLSELGSLQTTDRASRSAVSSPPRGTGRETARNVHLG